MKVIKITFFNPETIKKRIVRIKFSWDVSNHCWNVTITNIFGESTRRYYGKPEDFVSHYQEYNIRHNEYVTIKNIKCL